MIAKSIPQKSDLAVPKGHRLASISQLNPGLNKDVVVSAKVIHTISKSAEVPVSLLVMDGSQRFCVVSLYHASKSLTDKIRSRSDILIRNPLLVDVELNFKGYSYGYQCVKVTDMNDFQVNGSVLREESAPGQVISTTFS